MNKNKKAANLIFLYFGMLSAQKPFISIITHTIGGNAGWYHPALTRSLCDGMAKISASFNFNPPTIHELGEVVVVLTDPTGALRQAIQLKRQGVIKKLLAGPNLMVRAIEYGGILSSSEIDLCIVPCEWAKIAYEEDAPLLRGRIQIWFAGVDVNYFKPRKSNALSNNVIVYWKTEGEGFCQQVENLLIKYGWNPIRIRYGNYKVVKYRTVLEDARFAVFISRSESQGLALAEAWSMDVPTLVWDPEEPLDVNNGKIYWPVSAAPYLNKQGWYVLEKY